MITLAVDPDTQCSGLCLADEHRIYAVGVADTRALGLRGMAAAVEQGAALGHEISMMTRILPPFALDRFVVEAQQVYSRGGVNANNLLPLAMVAGAAMAAGRRLTKWVRCPLPRDWKGQLKKEQSHRATLEHYGIAAKRGLRGGAMSIEWPDDVQFIGDMDVVNGPHLKEVLDAAGLALWGARQRV